MQAPKLIHRVLTSTLLVVCATCHVRSADPPVSPSMKLWKEVQIAPWSGTFPCLGDLDSDGRVDFLLYRQGPQTTPGLLVALDHDGRELWRRGDEPLQGHQPDGMYQEPALRGIALIHDLDADGHSEVVTELWEEGQPWLFVLEGATGKVKHARPSPLDLKVRAGRRSRCHPVARIAYLNGRDARPAIVLLYGASGFVPCHAIAVDHTLDTLWHASADGDAVAHVPSVADLDGDGRDEVICGTWVVDEQGETLWQKPYLHHADCTAVLAGQDAEVSGVLLSICNSGPAGCLSTAGKLLWEKSRQEVSHGQGIWVGNFLEDEPGAEAIICRSGHRGDFLTVRATDGGVLGAFQHQRELEGYPDFPCVVQWPSRQVQSLWIPIDRRLVDGLGRTVAELGEYEEPVRQRLQWGTTKSHVAVQAFALDLCGDERDELVLYQPYNGQSIFIFTQHDSDGRGKPYVHVPSVFNIRSYF